MKIAVIAANGKTGSLFTKDAIDAGHDVTAIVRGENRSAAQKAIIRDIMEITKEDVAGFDAVVDAFGGWRPEVLPMHVESVKHIADLLAGTETHFYVVGGAGSLWVDEDGTRLLSTDQFPAEFRPLATAQSDQLDYLRTRDDFVWTFVSPAIEYNAEGERTGTYTIVESDLLTFDEDGKSAISYADYALGLLELVERGGNVRERVNIRY